ncbi:hypothetical protein [Aquimarina agarilytica]|uniref:hypothetical protein n=1 Tax=Aquimarina agarilytica TaxID=1087449 RepID=UPI000287FC94|nr:hypothetical protein [Aquimarina agarilytica]
MNTLYSIIQHLTLEERSAFLFQLKKKNKRNDTKNIQLFKLLEKGNTNNAELSILLYGKKTCGAFHALCKRLHDSLIDFVAIQSFSNESSEELEVLKLLMASRVFFEQKKHKIGFKTLRKATLQAKKLNLFSILDEIYYTQIQYAHEDPSVDLQQCINQLTENKIALQQEENLNLFYAIVQNQLTNNSKSTEEIISENLLKFNISPTQNLSYKSLFKILEITTKSANINRDYNSILGFIEKNYQALHQNERQASKQLFYHIQVLYYMANSNFRSRNFNNCQHYLELMAIQMQEQNNKYYSRFIPQYTLLKTLWLNYTNQPQKAIDTLTHFNFKKHTDQISYVLDLKLCLIVCLFQQSQFKIASGLINQLDHSDTWYTQKASMIWVIKKNIIELLLHMELDNFDLVFSRLKSFQKKHSKYLKEKNESLVLNFVKCIGQFYFNDKNTNTPKMINEVQKISNALNPKTEDLFNLSFFAWLKAKIDKTDLYETTLKLINNPKLN